MKNTHRFLIAVAACALFASSSQAKAGSGSCCDDGIAASPKVRAMLDERCKSRCAAPEQVAVTSTIPHSAVAASPKVQQMRNERAPALGLQITAETAGYQPTGADGVTASPKVRATLDEHRQAVEIAPLK